MSLTKKQRSEIQNFILWNLRDHPSDIVRLTQQKFKLSRTAVLRYIHKLAQEDQIEVQGSTKDRRYFLRPLKSFDQTYQIQTGLVEDKVWRNDVFPLLNGMKENVIGICQYGFTEIFNNALDHSGGTYIAIHIKVWIDRVQMNILDDGVGIFNKIRLKYELDDPLHAILELSKGKLTTEPESHSGEGIFFTSRMFDVFAILSGSLGFINMGNLDLLTDLEEDTKGTTVRMEISTNSERTTESIFSKFASLEFGFHKTIVPVKLARYGNENLVSRSQAKRLLSRLERFKNVVLDFSEIPEIGRAFADEIFRVFVNAHPGTTIIPVNHNKRVKSLIAEVQRNRN